MQSGLIAHLDIDRFFANLALQRRPDLQNLPFGVYNPWRKTPLMAVNELASQYGLESGMRISQARKICPNLQLVIEDPEMQNEASLDFFRLLIEKNPEANIEPYGIDEAFLDYGGKTLLEAISQFRELMGTVNQTLRAKWGLTVSGCLASNKWLAKMGTNFIKPRGLLIIPSPSFVRIFYPLAVRKFHGINEKIGQRLNEMGIETIGEISQIPLTNLIGSFGLALGTKLYFLCRGEGDKKVISWRPVKSIGNTISCHSSSFWHLKGRIKILTSRVFQRMAEGNYWVKTVIVSVRFKENGLRWVSKAKSLPRYFNEREIIDSTALDLLSQLLKEREINRLGLKVTNLIKGWSQLRLL